MSDSHVYHDDDFETLARDLYPVRNLRAEDFDHVLRIDHKVTGRDRRDYLRRKFDEALAESAVQVSLVAEADGRPVGFIMARVDHGDFGRIAASAVLDTLGVSPDFAGKGVGRALLSQLLVNLRALGVERVESEVARESFDLLGFFYHLGFAPAQRLAFHKRIV